MHRYLKRRARLFLALSVIILIVNVSSLFHESDLLMLLNQLSFAVVFPGLAMLMRLNARNKEMFNDKGSLLQLDREQCVPFTKYLLLHLSVIAFVSLFVRQVTNLTDFMMTGIPFGFFGFWGCVNLYLVFSTLSAAEGNKEQQ